MKKKSDQVEDIMKWFLHLKEKFKIKVKNIRLDNSGENKSLQDRCLQEGLGIEFEFTSPGTPQHNAYVERAFPTLMGRGRAMMNHAGFTEKMRHLLWCEAASTATKLDNVITNSEGNECAYKTFYKQDPKYSEFLRTFGEVGITADSSNKKTRSKLEPRGRECILIGYASDHAGDCYRFLNMKTNHIVLSRDVQWLGNMWAEYKQV